MRRSFSIIVPLLVLVASSPALAQDGAIASEASFKALAAGILLGLGILGGALGQGRAAGAAFEGIARNPSSRSEVFVPFILGLALIESLVLIGAFIGGKLAGVF